MGQHKTQELKKRDLMINKKTYNFDDLLQLSQSLWGKTNLKSLIQAFAELLCEYFNVKEIGLIGIDGQNQTVSIKKPSFRLKNTASLSEPVLENFTSELKKLPLKSDEIRESINRLVCLSESLCFILVGDPSSDWFVLVWKDIAITNTKPAVPVGYLEFLILQLQSECRWFTKFDRTQALLHRDDLTGLYNYRYLDIALDSELRRAQRFHTSFCLLFLDLDNFKSINDRFGHLAGSNLLKQVAKFLQNSLREVDSIIRYGGDEYIILLLGSNSQSGLLTAERIRAGLEKEVFKLEDGEEVSITTSIGVAAYPEHTREKETLVRMADETQYRSKRGGKNRVMIVGQEHDGPLPFQEISEQKVLADLQKPH